MAAAKQSGDAAAVVWIRKRHAKRQQNLAIRLQNAQKWRAKMLTTSLENPAKAVNDVIKFAEHWGGMSDIQADVAAQLRDRLAKQQTLSAQSMLRRQVALKQIMETMGWQKPDWLPVMIARTQHAAQHQAQVRALQLQVKKQHVQGDNPNRPKLQGKTPPNMAPPPQGLKPPEKSGHGLRSPSEKPKKKKGWFR